MHELIPNSSPNLAALSASHLNVPGRSGTSTPQRISSEDNGYLAANFPGKKAQASAVEKLIQTNGFVPAGLIAGEVGWFYESLG